MDKTKTKLKQTTTKIKNNNSAEIYKMFGKLM